MPLGSLMSAYAISFTCGMLGAIMEIGKLDIVFNPVSTLQKASVISTGREQANVIQ